MATPHRRAACDRRGLLPLPFLPVALNVHLAESSGSCPCPKKAGEGAGTLDFSPQGPWAEGLACAGEALPVLLKETLEVEWAIVRGGV